MIQQASNRDVRSNGQTAQPVPTFKPVALPALAAAVRAVKIQPKRPRNPELPAILRKDADLG